MKKIFSILVLAVMAVSAFAISYKNNTYQKLADECTKKAQVALDAGQYTDAVEYSRLAEENAELSRAYIEMMMARKNADDSLKIAKNKLAWAEGVNASVNFPMAYTSAKENYASAEGAYKNEDYDKAAEYAKLVLTLILPL